jgi:hypothetical protein
MCEHDERQATNNNNNNNAFAAAFFRHYHNNDEEEASSRRRPWQGSREVPSTCVSPYRAMLKPIHLPHLQWPASQCLDSVVCREYTWS